jgi:hypothetical protein
MASIAFLPSDPLPPSRLSIPSMVYEGVPENVLVGCVWGRDEARRILSPLESIFLLVEIKCTV